MKNPSQCRAGKPGLSLGFVLWTNRNTPNVPAGVNGVAGLPTPRTLTVDYEIGKLCRK